MPSTIQQVVADKKLEMLRGYFPRVQFNRLKETNRNSHDYRPDEILDILDLYIYEPISGKYRLNISDMVKKDFFKPLFPAPATVKKYIAEINKMDNSDEHLDIIKFFIKKEDEKFASTLNTLLLSADKIDPGVTLTEQFFKDFKKKYLCRYSSASMDNDNSKGEFLWDFLEEPLFHDDDMSIHGIYGAFNHYTHKNVALYYYGLDFYNFKNKSSKWPNINNGSKQKLPEYFSESGKPSKGLSKQVNSLKINAFDFIWGNSAWTETNSVKYLLKRLGLREELKISLKDIYNSFCVPVLYNKSFTNVSKNTRFNVFKKLGFDIIVNTLLRRMDLAVKQILSKNDYIFKKLKKEKKLSEEQIKELKDEFAEIWPRIWGNVIYQILENVPKEKRNRYNPLDFPTFLKRVSVYSNYEYANRFNKKQELHENELDPHERSQINSISKKILNYIPVEVLNSLHITGDLKYGDAYKKLESLIEVMNSCEQARDVFPDEYEIIKALALKIGTRSSNVTVNDKELSIFDSTKSIMPNPFETLINEQDKIEAQEENVEIMKRLEPFIQSINECFESEFHGENDWLSFIRERTKRTDELWKLWSDMRSYLPRSAGHLSGARYSRIFMDYCTISGIPYDNLVRSLFHTKPFVPKMRSIASELQNRGYWR